MAVGCVCLGSCGNLLGDGNGFDYGLMMMMRMMMIVSLEECR